MAVKINNITIIDNDRNLYIQDITFSDTTIASTASGTGGNNTELLDDNTVKVSNVLNPKIQLLGEINGDTEMIKLLNLIF